jgi:hypothetical protein
VQGNYTRSYLIDPATEVQLYRNLTRGRYRRQISAAALLLSLFFGIASHALLLDEHGHEDHSQLASMEQEHVEHHDDDCVANEVCDQDRDNPESPSLQDESTHHNVLVSSFTFSLMATQEKVGRIDAPAVHVDFRTLTPPFLPPKHA